MNVRSEPARVLPMRVLPGLLTLAMAAPLQAADDFTSLFTEGKAHAAFRYRLENVDQDAFAEDATASTLRTRLNEETMSFQERNIAASLGVFTLILGFYLTRVFQMIQNDSFNLANMVRLWEIVIILGIVVTIIGTILAHIGSGIIEAIKTQNEPVIEDIQDERDRLIDLKGTRIAYLVSSIGVFLSMLTFALGQPPLVMFSLLILSGLVAQIISDISRLVLYRRGF